MKIKGEMLWMVMVILLILSMGALYIAHLQVQTIRVNQWHDMAIRLEYAMDRQIDSTMKSSDELFITPWRHINDWQTQPAVSHQHLSWGAELHWVVEGAPEISPIYRINLTGYHPMGILLKKQCVFSCVRGMCQQLSCILS